MTRAKDVTPFALSAIRLVQVFPFFILTSRRSHFIDESEILTNHTQYVSHIKDFLFKICQELAKFLIIVSGIMVIPIVKTTFCI